MIESYQAHHQKSFLMNSIDFDSLLITIFVLVDDWYQIEGKALKGRTPGAKPEMSDSEILTLAVAMDYLPFPGETQFIGFIRANYRQWFPELLAQSQFNRRLRKLGQMLMKYFGYKLVMLSTLEGIPIAYDLVPANTDERHAVEGVLEVVNGCEIYGDQGFIGQQWQAEIANSTGNCIWTIHRSNQHQQPSADFKRLISRVRQRIEGVFHEIQNTGRNPERLLNKTVTGFTTHMAAKIASHTLRLLLRRQFGVDVQTFQSVTPC